MRRVCVLRPRYVRSVPACERAGRRRLAADYGKPSGGCPAASARPARPPIFARIFSCATHGLCLAPWLVRPAPPRQSLDLPPPPPPPPCSRKRHVAISKVPRSGRRGAGDLRDPSTGVKRLPATSRRDATRRSGDGPHVNRYTARRARTCVRVYVRRALRTQRDPLVCARARAWPSRTQACLRNAPFYETIELLSRAILPGAKRPARRCHVGSRGGPFESTTARRLVPGFPHPAGFRRIRNRSGQYKRLLTCARVRSFREIAVIIIN